MKNHISHTALCTHTHTNTHTVLIVGQPLGLLSSRSAPISAWGERKREEQATNEACKEKQRNYRTREGRRGFFLRPILGLLEFTHTRAQWVWPSERVMKFPRLPLFLTPKKQTHNNMNLNFLLLTLTKARKNPVLATQEAKEEEDARQSHASKQ